MIRSLLILAIIGCMIVAAFGAVLAVDLGSSFTAIKGKNSFVMPERDSLYFAKNFLESHPSIQAISYRDVNGETVGYIAAFGGIGKNFELKAGETYEIISGQDITFIVP